MRKTIVLTQLLLVLAACLGIHSPAFTQDSTHIKDAKGQIDYQIGQWNKQYDNSKNQTLEPQKIEAAATQTYYEKLKSNFPKQKEREDKMLELGKEELPETGGNITGTKVNSISKVNTLETIEN